MSSFHAYYPIFLHQPYFTRNSVAKTPLRTLARRPEIQTTVARSNHCSATWRWCSSTMHFSTYFRFSFCVGMSEGDLLLGAGNVRPKHQRVDVGTPVFVHQSDSKATLVWPTGSEASSQHASQISTVVWNISLTKILIHVAVRLLLPCHSNDAQYHAKSVFHSTKFDGPTIIRSIFRKATSSLYKSLIRIARWRKAVSNCFWPFFNLMDLSCEPVRSTVPGSP